MAILTTEEQRQIAQKYVRRAYKEIADVADLATDDIIAAIQPTETWIADNQVSFNAVLSTTFKDTATTAQKTLLFCYVAMKRAGLI